MVVVVVVVESGVGMKGDMSMEVGVCISMEDTAPSDNDDGET